ncbi:hypothetical protein KKC60_03845 [Patescibacteria group bacterium]|nr:hypothetical protein [Patescibacteria group bacterium]
MEKVKLQKEQCKKIAEIISELTSNKSYLKRPYLCLHGDKEKKLRAYLLSVAICHQTQNLFSKKYQLAGWDYIEKVYNGKRKLDSCVRVFFET